MSKTRQLLDSLYGMYYRLDTGRSGSRNVNAFERDVTWKWGLLQEALEAGGYEELDANPRLAAKHAKVERRHTLGEKFVTT